jgi:hypothetical protein
MISRQELTLLAKPTFIKPPTPRASGEINGCIEWIKAFDPFDCGAMLFNLDLNIAVFYKMNPSVGNDCTGLSLGSNYCLSTIEIGINHFDQDEGSSPPPTSPSSKPPVGSGTPTPIQVSKNLFIWKHKLTSL